MRDVHAGFAASQPAGCRAAGARVHQGPDVIVPTRNRFVLWTIVLTLAAIELVGLVWWKLTRRGRK
jgi:hypothetical protein